MNRLLLISFLFTISFIIGLTVWKSYDAGILDRVSSPLNPGIFERAYDAQFFDSLPSILPKSTNIDQLEFSLTNLTEAIAWSKPIFKNISDVQSKTELSSRHINISYTSPPVDIEGFYQYGKSKNLIIIIPGYGMNINDIFTTEGNSLSELSKSVNDWNYNMLVINPIQSPYMAAAINTRLIMSGLQLHGFQARQVCDTVKLMNNTNKYQSIIIYGIGSGGLIADFVSLLCKEQSLTIVDGLPIPIKNSLWRAIRLHLTDNPLIYQFQKPLLQFLNTSFFSKHSLTNKVYLLDKDSMHSIQGELSGNLLPLNKMGKTEGKIIFIEKPNANNITFNPDIIKNIIYKKYTPYTGWYLIDHY